ncbi:MAG: hypothetical protein RMK20_15640, partial [Verrucomicrobiales bacterium]|nr:hypothetical protein [Verrucomicrobiales bacterium]
MLTFFPPSRDRGAAVAAGFRFGHVGTHTSRTIMLRELAALLSAVPVDGRPDEYVAAIVEGNCLGKPTVSTRRLTLQRLRELYALDPAVPLFRILRRLWDVDEQGRPLLALLASLARDPLLLATADAVLSLPEGAEFQRSAMREALAKAVEERLNESTLNKVVRNAASSWSQSGHLEGRTFKFRRHVRPTPAALALALYLAHAAGLAAEESFSSGWVKVLDCSASAAQELATAAKRLGLIDLRMAGDVIDLNLDRLDPA